MPALQKGLPGLFGYNCPDPACRFNLEDLTRRSTTQWIVNKDQQHRELLTCGDWATRLAGQGQFTNNVVIAFVPEEVVGSGNSIFQSGLAKPGSAWRRPGP